MTTEFDEWLRKAYGTAQTFTEWNMEVAYYAGAKAGVERYVKSAPAVVEFTAAVRKLEENK